MSKRTKAGQVEMVREAVRLSGIDLWDVMFESPRRDRVLVRAPQVLREGILEATAKSRCPAVFESTYGGEDLFVVMFA